MQMAEYVGNAENTRNEMNLRIIKSDLNDIPPSVKSAGTPTIESLEKRQTTNEIGDTS